MVDCEIRYKIPNADKLIVIPKTKKDAFFIIKNSYKWDLEKYSKGNFFIILDKNDNFLFNLKTLSLLDCENNELNYFLFNEEHPWVFDNINFTEKEQLSAVKINSHILKYLKNPSEKVKISAMKHDGSALFLIDDPSEAVQLAAVKNYSLSIGCIKEPSEKVQWVAINKQPQLSRKAFISCNFISSISPEIKKVIWQRHEILLKQHIIKKGKLNE